MLSGRDVAIQVIERVTRTDRVGRILPRFTDVAESCILVFAAHPDDDVLGVGITMNRHVSAGDHVRVVFTTNGGGHHRSRRDILNEARTRYEEACAALAVIGIERDNVLCLGYPDGRLYRYMMVLAHDVKRVIQNTQPTRVYVHSIEGGHRDHDITSFVVQSVCKQIGYTEVYEWAEYNSLHTFRDMVINFPPGPDDGEAELMRVKLTEDERVLKNAMLMAHKSQVAAMRFSEYESRSELVRQCKLGNLEQKLRHFWNYSINLERLSASINNVNSL